MIKFAIRTITRMVVVSVMFSVFANPTTRTQAVSIVKSVVDSATSAISGAITDAATQAAGSDEVQNAAKGAAKTATNAAVQTAVNNASKVKAEDVQAAASELLTKTRVVRVIDGDTFTVRMNGTETTVRIIGVNAPESVKKNSPVECYGPEASKFLKQLLPKGKVVILKYGKGRTDKYGRTLAYVSLSNGTDVQRELLSQGYARTMTIKPNTARADEFKGLENGARDANAGLWAACS